MNACHLRWVILGLLRIVAGSEILPSVPNVSDIARIRNCTLSSPDELCVNVRFEGHSQGEAHMICLWYTSDRATPELEDFLKVNAVATCGLSAEVDCPVVFGDHLRQETTYYVFCSGFSHSNVSGLPSLYYLDAKPQCSEAPCGVVVRTDDDQRKIQAHAFFGTTDLVLALLLLVYILWGWVFQHVPCARFLHETGFAVIAGLFAGYVLNRLQGPVIFRYSLFQYYLLPMVIFGAGFNLEKQHFFRYASYIMALGVTGTVLVFVFIYHGSELTNLETNKGEALVLTPHQRLVMASVLAATDSVAPIAFLPPDLFPRLFAVVFGEGVLNDVVSILLSEATARHSVDELPAVTTLLGSIAVLLITSLGIGLVFGLGTSLVFKHLKPLREATCWLKPTSFMLLMNYICYLVADLCEFSSIFALFVCSLLCGHYAAFSLSKDARHFAEELAEMMGYLAEAFVFGYFGVTAVFFIDTDKFSLQLIGIYMGCILLARFLTVFYIKHVLSIVKVIYCGHRLKLTYSEMSIIGLAGCMRGTVAYALILKNVPRQDEMSESQEIMVSTVLGIVLINCLVFGGIFPVAVRLAGLAPKSQLLGKSLHEISERELIDSDSEDESTPPPSPRLPESALARRGALVDAPQLDNRPRWGATDAHGRCRSAHLHDAMGDAWHNFDEKWLIPVFRPTPTEEEELQHYNPLGGDWSVGH